MSSRGRPSGNQDYQAAGQQVPGGYPAPQYAGKPSRYSGGGGAAAGSILAGILMILVGLLGFLDGLAMVTKKAFFTFHAGYAYHWSTAGWGWTLLILGAVVFAAGICVMLGMVWARTIGVILAALSAVASFLTLPYYPIWSIVLIVVDVFLIWALIARGRRV